MSAYQCNFNIYILTVVQQNVSTICQQMKNKRRCHVGKKNTFYRSTDQFVRPIFHVRVSATLVLSDNMFKNCSLLQIIKMRFISYFTIKPKV